MAARRLSMNGCWYAEQSSIIKIITLYRYVSLIVTSFFYFISQPGHSLSKRLMVILCISGSAILLNYLYIRNKGQTKKILLIILIETIGNSLILMPSGGVASPYVWYSLNTILIASVELSMEYCWLNLFVYMTASLLLSEFIKIDDAARYIDSINSERNLVLSLILITIAMQLMARYVKGLQESGILLSDANNQLQCANKKIKESMNHIMELYQAANLFCSFRDYNELVLLILDFTHKITKTDTVFFYDNAAGRSNIYIYPETVPEDLKDILLDDLYDQFGMLTNIRASIRICAANNSFDLIPIRSDHKDYGVLGIKSAVREQGLDSSINEDLLAFVEKLSIIAFERFYLEQVNDRLVVTEEQNRIANEIHDNVLQRLFSISCGIYSLKRKQENGLTAAMDEELDIIREAINSSMNELRSTIYGLSWRKHGTDNFKADIEAYINQIRTMNNTSIEFRMSGDSELVASVQKKAIYRIVCEATGNSVRHGGARVVNINLKIGIEEIVLEIDDDGVGFDVDTADISDKGGIGIKNIRFLVNLFKGRLTIKSVIGKGTNIKINVPNTNEKIGGKAQNESIDCR